MKKKKIFITNSSLEVGGIERSLVNLLKNIDYNQYEVDLFLIRKKGILLTEVPKNVRVFSYEDVFDKPYNIIKLLVVIFKNNFLLRRLVQKKFADNYDIAIAFDGYNNIVDIVASCVKAKNKYIWVHSDYNQRIKESNRFRKQFKRMRQKYNYFDYIVAVSKGAKKSFQQLMPNKRVIVCYNIVDENELNNKLKENADYILKGDIKIVGVGRLIKEKGFYHFIDIINKLIQAFPKYDIKGYIIGDGEEKEQLEKRIGDLKLQKQVILLGEKKNPFPIIKQGDLFLMTSFIEGFSLVVLEALICEVPVIMPNVASGKEFKQEIAPKNALVLTSADVNSLYIGIKDAINNLDNMQFSFSISEYNKVAKNYLKQIIN